MKKRLMGNKDIDMLCHMSLDSEASKDELGNAITYYDSPAFSSGKFGNGLSKGVALCKVSNANFHDRDFTLSVWIKVVSQKFEIGCGVGLNRTRESACQIGFNVNYSNSIGAITMLLSNSSGTGWSDYLTFMGKIPNDGLFHHVAMTYKSKVLSVYVDGVKTYSSGIVFNLNRDLGYVMANSADSALIIDDLMVAEGVLWEDNFTPPTKPYN